LAQLVQLIINGTTYPTVTRDKYKVYDTPRGEQIEMADGTLVTELSGYTRFIEYSNDYFKPELMRQCMTDLRFGNPLTVAYIAPESDEMISGIFKCVSSPTPTFAFDRDGIAFWHGISFRLQSAKGFRL
jgi:hypothetical protein